MDKILFVLIHLVLASVNNASPIKPISFEADSVFRPDLYRDPAYAFDNNVSTFCHTQGGNGAHWVQGTYPYAVCPLKIVVINGKDDSTAAWLYGASVYLLNTTGKRLQSTIVNNSTEPR